MRSVPFCLLAACALVLGASCANAAQVGVWQFNGNLNNGIGGGAAMSAIGGWTPSYVTEMIGGLPATVLSFPAMSASQALDMPNEASPNGGSATTTNIWSIVMDVRFTAASNYMSVWETAALGTTDGDYFARDTEGIGTSSQYAGAYIPTDWNRIAVTIDSPVPGGGYKLKGYINGVWNGITATTGTTPDGKEAIAAALHLFADEDGEVMSGLVNSVAYYDVVLSDSDIAALGGASAAGVPEPVSIVLLSCGLAAIALGRSRRFQF